LQAAHRWSRTATRTACVPAPTGVIRKIRRQYIIVNAKFNLAPAYPRRAQYAANNATIWPIGVFAFDMQHGQTGVAVTAGMTLRDGRGQPFS
jgi:hypothetical protein